MSETTTVLIDPFADLAQRESILSEIADSFADSGSDFRMVGLTGPSGSGKTQLAFRYGAQHASRYTQEIFWLQSPQMWQRNLAQYGVRIRPEVASRSRHDQLQVGLQALHEMPDSLIIATDVPDLESLLRPIVGQIRLADLPGHILFTSANGDFAPYPTLPTSLFSKAEMMAVFHKRRPEMTEEEIRSLALICGRLPLLIVMCAAHLASRPQLSPEALAKRLTDAGAYPPDAQVGQNLRFQAGMKAMAAQCWNGLANNESRRLLQLAAQMPAEVVALRRLQLMSGLSAEEAKQAAGRLEREAILDHLFGDIYFLHSRVKDEINDLLPASAADKLKIDGLERILSAYEQIPFFQRAVTSMPSSIITEELVTLLDIYASVDPHLQEEAAHRCLGDRLRMVLDFFQQRDQMLRHWQPEQFPALFAQEAANFAKQRGDSPLLENAQAFLADRKESVLTLKWRRNSESPQLSHTFQGHTSYVNNVVVSADGNVIVSAGWDKTLRVWDLKSLRSVEILSGHDAGIVHVALSPDAGLAAAARFDNRISIWNMDSFRLETHLEGHESGVMVTAFTPDGKRLYSADQSGLILEWDVTKGWQRRQFARYARGLNVLAVSPNGKWLIGGGVDRNIVVWRLSDGERLCRALAQTNGLAISPSGRYIATGGGEQMALIWELTADGRKLELKKQLRGHSGSVNGVAWGNDDDVVWSAGADSVIKGWRWRTDKSYITLFGHNGPINSIAITADGKQAISASFDRTVRVWDVAGKAPILDTTQLKIAAALSHQGPVQGVAISPDGAWGASAGYDRQVKVWKIGSGELNRVFLGHEDGVNDLAFIPNSTLLASVGSDNAVRLWDLESGAVVKTILLTDSPARCLVADPSGRLLYLGDLEGGVLVLDWEGERVLHRKPAHAGMTRQLAISTDKRWLSSGGWDKTVCLWALPDLTLTQRFVNHTDYVNGVTISPAGNLVASASADQTVRLWDSVTGEQKRLYNSHAGIVTAVQLLPDGAAISVGSDHLLRWWQTDGLNDIAYTKLPHAPASFALSPSGDFCLVGDMNGGVACIESVN